MGKFAPAIMPGEGERLKMLLVSRKLLSAKDIQDLRAYAGVK